MRVILYIIRIVLKDFFFFMIYPDRPESLGRQNDRRRSYLHITRIFYIIYARGTQRKK